MAIGIVVWLYVLAYFFIASFFNVVRATVFSWALLFALIHSIAFALLALALLEAPQALTYVRSYFASGDMAPASAIVLAISGALFIAVLAATIAYISVHFSWPSAFVTTIPEVIAYTLIAVWLNTVVLHVLKASLGIGPHIFGSFAKLGPTFWLGILVGVLAAITQSGTQQPGTPNPVRAAKLKSRLELPAKAQQLQLPNGAP
ncbi:MAG: hypothetical protein SGJ03_11465 [Alphaproteobacteria bacterium]|nr:hypothetical protein [Alphaproteobacteria bacterium]